MITKKVGRALPRMAVASLALGGPALMSGCGKSSDPVKDYCRTIASCDGYGSAYVNACESDIDYAISYYSAACRSAIRKALACAAHRNTCYEIDYQYFGECYDEFYDEYLACGFYYL